MKAIKEFALTLVNDLETRLATATDRVEHALHKKCISKFKFIQEKILSIVKDDLTFLEAAASFSFTQGHKKANGMNKISSNAINDTNNDSKALSIKKSTSILEEHNTVQLSAFPIQEFSHVPMQSSSHPRSFSAKNESLGLTSTHENVKTKLNRSFSVPQPIIRQPYVSYSIQAVPPHAYTNVDIPRTNSPSISNSIIDPSDTKSLFETQDHAIENIVVEVDNKTSIMEGSLPVLHECSD